MPGVVGYQADMAHNMLFVLGVNAEKDRLLPDEHDWSDKAALDVAYKRVADALRPWTLDFHVAQNDGTTLGSGDARRQPVGTCRVDHPNGRLDITKHAGYWLRDEKGNLTKKTRHICWDGCIFPNAVMESQETWNACSAPWSRCATPTVARVRAEREHPAWRRKPLNIGMVGYGFMGRAHSNAYRKVGNFFDSNTSPC